MGDELQLPLDSPIEHRISGGADVSSLGRLLAIVVTESDSRFTFERGVLKTSPDQFFDISLHLSRKVDA